ncbi:hypothetical protein DPMN_126581 [Dreissena polymorpha]|uniref:Uncharacterized protein n=1 Tax=Dreissena polymorpha TaxID=45954 RepID=A0A9D4GZQ5_DREPO|nr:hypothetical protein DPMN_126568 [Dreissena polymorpha]KAH3824728.1 hypothetical protein DPMN_126581 [Dreissena polymorpha]
MFLKTAPLLLHGAQERQVTRVFQIPIQTTVKQGKLAWFEHVNKHDSLFKTVLYCTQRGGHY